MEASKAPIVALQKLRGENEDLRNELRQISSKLDEVLSKQHAEAPPVKDDRVLKISSTQKLIASIEREVEILKSTASSSSIEGKLKLEEETAALKEKIRETTQKNKELQRQVNDGGRKIETLSNNPEESKELKIILEELRTSKEKLKEMETKYQGEKQRNEMIQSKITELENEAGNLGIDYSNIGAPKGKGKADDPSASEKAREISALKNRIKDMEKSNQTVFGQNKKRIAEAEEVKNVYSDKIAMLNKTIKDKEHEKNLKEHEINQLKRTQRNLQMKLGSAPDINIESDKPDDLPKGKFKGSKYEAKEEDKPKEGKPAIRQLSVHNLRQDKKKKHKEEDEEKSDDHEIKEKIKKPKGLKKPVVEKVDDDRIVEKIKEKPKRQVERKVNEDESDKERKREEIVERIKDKTEKTVKKLRDNSSSSKGSKKSSSSRSKSPKSSDDELKRKQTNKVR